MKLIKNGNGLEKNNLPLSFYLDGDVVKIARELIGKMLFSTIDGELTGGVIAETEAYRGAEDKASHAYGNRRTKRTEVLFWQGGITYVYKCYGIHHLLNVVTAPEGIPHAVLIRGIIPMYGIEVMQKRRKKEKKLCTGPGSLCQALGISSFHNGISLEIRPLWIEDHGIVVEKINHSPRIGVDYAGEDARLPYRFFLDSSFKIS